MPNAAIYNPYTDTWKSLPKMAYPRWYPTLVLMPNGKDVFVDSGAITPEAGVATVPEYWNADLGQFVQLTSAVHYPDLYPMLYLSPRGTIFNPGPQVTTHELTTSGAGSITNLAMNPINLDIGYGSSAVYAPGKAIVAGGGTPVANAELVDFTGPTPKWTAGPSMSIARRQFDLTILPTGDILATGGSSGPGFTNHKYPVFTTEVWTPGTNVWRQWAPSTTTGDMASYRGYHSNGILLPDGRIFSSTGDDGADPNRPNPSYQLFTPPYLTGLSRPSITACPSAAVYGDTLQFTVASSVNVVSASLMRLSVQTHCVNSGQIYYPLQLNQNGDQFFSKLPSDPNYTPPGYYMLFVFDANGAHSVGQIFRLGADLPTPQGISVSPSADGPVVSWNPWFTGSNPVDVMTSEDGEEFSVATQASDPSVALPSEIGNYVELRTDRGGILSSLTGPVRITPGTTTILPQTITGYHNYHTSALAQVVDENGIGVPYATVQLTIGGQYVAQGVTDTTGHVEIGFIEAPLMLGQSAQLSFAGNAMLTGSTATVATNFTPEPTTGQISSVVAPAGTTVKLNARLLLPHFYSQAPDAGMTTTFAVDGTTIGTTTTDSTGTAYITYAIPATGPSVHTISMSCQGDAYYAAGTATGTITIGADKTQIWIGQKSAVVNQTITIPMTLQYSYPDLSYIGGASLSIMANGVLAGTVTTDSTGWASFTYTTPSTPGPVSLTVNFAGAPMQGASTATSTVPVAVDGTSIWVNSTQSGAISVPTTIAATLMAKTTHQYLAGQTVVFSTAAGPFGTAVTDSSGWARCAFTPSLLSPSPVAITLSFAGTASYTSSSASTSFNLVKNNSAVWVGSRSMVAKQLVTIPASLQDAKTLTYLPGRQLIFSINGQNLGSVVTDANGMCSLKFTAPATLGTYQIQVKFLGDYRCNASSGTANLTVTLDPTSIYVPNITASAGSATTLKGQLKDGFTGLYLSGQTVTFSVNGTVVGTAVSDSTGWINFPYTAPSTPGSYTITASFAGNSTCQPCSGTSTLTVK
jgi:hypothetical protein